MALDHSKTHNSLYPNRAPPSMFVAKFPGSMYATDATKAGPRYHHAWRRTVSLVPGNPGAATAIVGDAECGCGEGMG